MKLRYRLKNRIVDIFVYISAFVAAFAIISLITYIGGKNPVKALGAFFGVITNLEGISEILVRATPILFCGLGLAVAFKSGFWNVGAEGQLYMGGLGGWLIAYSLPGVSNWIVIPTALITAFIFGAFWCAIPGVLKVRREVNEVMTTLFLNFIAIFFISYLAAGPLLEEMGSMGWSSPIPSQFKFSRIIPSQRIHIGFIIAIVLTVLLYFTIKRTPWGYRVTALGSNIQAARFGGIDISRNMIIITLISGGLAGLAGMSEVFGVRFRLMPELSADFGYIGIVAAWLAKNNPAGTVVTSFILGWIVFGGKIMQMRAGVTSAIVLSLLGFIYLFTLIFGKLVPRIGFIKKLSYTEGE